MPAIRLLTVLALLAVSAAPGALAVCHGVLMVGTCAQATQGGATAGIGLRYSGAHGDVVGGANPHGTSGGVGLSAPGVNTLVAGGAGLTGVSGYVRAVSYGIGPETGLYAPLGYNIPGFFACAHPYACLPP